jgi:hypothetical protein
MLVYCNMIAITSISPSHKNFETQKKAIQSWIEAGYKPVSLNSKEEIALLTEFKDVEFIETVRTNEVLFKRPYVIISAIIDHLKQRSEEHFMIINSDIIIKGTERQTENLKLQSNEGVIIINRNDFKEEENGISKRYELGFDGFFINKKWIHIFPQSILCLGQCFWDFWIPYQCVLAKVPIFRMREPYLYHKAHPIQYSTEDWLATGHIIRGECHVQDAKLSGQRDIPRMAEYIYSRIKNNLR